MDEMTRRRMEEMVAESYGMEYLLGTSGTFEHPEPKVVANHIKFMQNTVLMWMRVNRRIPTVNPRADQLEQRMGNWLRALLFYGHIALDPSQETFDDVAENNRLHEICQRAFLTGSFSDGQGDNGGYDPEEGGRDDSFLEDDEIG